MALQVTTGTEVLPSEGGAGDERDAAAGIEGRESGETLSWVIGEGSAGPRPSLTSPGAQEPSEQTRPRTARRRTLKVPMADRIENALNFTAVNSVDVQHPAQPTPATPTTWALTRNANLAPDRVCGGTRIIGCTARRYPEVRRVRRAQDSAPLPFRAQNAGTLALRTNRWVGIVTSRAARMRAPGNSAPAFSRRVPNPGRSASAVGYPAHHPGPHMIRCEDALRRALEHNREPKPAAFPSRAGVM